jgi:hypothetical protein
VSFSVGREVSRLFGHFLEDVIVHFRRVADIDIEIVHSKRST